MEMPSIYIIHMLALISYTQLLLKFRRTPNLEKNLFSVVVLHAGDVKNGHLM